MNKYYQILDKILEQGKPQANKKGNIRYLLNEQLSLSPAAEKYNAEPWKCAHVRE